MPRSHLLLQQATALGGKAFDLCHSQFDEQRVSPKKEWYLCEHGDPQGADILLINADGRRWSLSYQDTYGIDYSGEIRYFKWTPDEAFLYFAVMEPWEMYGPFTANADALFRMDLSDGSVVKLLGTVDTFQPEHDFYIVSISPTGRRLAYSGGYNWLGTALQIVLHILDFQSGQEFLIPMDLKYYQIGNLTWSEDGLKLAYKLYSTGGEVCKYSYSVGLLDLQKKSAVTFRRDQPVDECGGNPGSYEILNVSDQAVLLEYQGEKWVYEIDMQKLHELN